MAPYCGVLLLSAVYAANGVFLIVVDYCVVQCVRIVAALAFLAFVPSLRSSSF